MVSSNATRNAGASKKKEEILKFVDSQMEQDDEASLEDLQLLLQREGVIVSLTSTWHWWRELGWSTKGTKYCQVVLEANTEKLLDWTKANVDDIYLGDLVFTDETTVQLENHRRLTCYKKGKETKIQAQAQAQAPH